MKVLKINYYDEQIKEYLQYKRMGGASERTLYEYNSLLGMFKKYLEIAKITDLSLVSRTMAERYIYKLMTEKNSLTGKKLSTVTINCRIIAYKDFFRFLVKNKNIKSNPFRLINCIKNEKRVFKNYLKQHEVRSLFSSMPETNEREIVYKLLLELSYHCALRISEALLLKTKDVDLEKGVLLIREGKGGYDRAIPLSKSIEYKLERYLSDNFSKCNEEFLFVSPKTGHSFTPVPIRKYLAKFVKDMNFKIKVTHHTLRHSIAKHLLERGLDIRYVQKFLGHHSINTTAQYTKLNLEDLQRALMTYHPRERFIKGERYA